MNLQYINYINTYELQIGVQYPPLQDFATAMQTDSPLKWHMKFIS